MTMSDTGPFWNGEDEEDPPSGCQFRIWMYGSGERCASKGPFLLVGCSKEGRRIKLNLCEAHERWIRHWDWKEISDYVIEKIDESIDALKSKKYPLEGQEYALRTLSRLRKYLKEEAATLSEDASMGRVQP